jgi:single-stranded DNA-binding protein
MAMNNEFQFIGHLASAPRLDTTKDTPICFMQIAVNSVYKDKDHKTVEKVQFHFIRAYGVKAENANKYLMKGQGVMVKGHVTSWYDKEKDEGGMFLTCDEIVYGRKPKGATSGGAANEPVQSATPATDDDDIPF